MRLNEVVKDFTPVIGFFRGLRLSDEIERDRVEFADREDCVAGDALGHIVNQWKKAGYFAGMMATQMSYVYGVYEAVKYFCR